MAAIDTIYNYYLSTYGSNTVNRYDTHKKSELRSVYNQMIKVNKESPLYKIKGGDSQDMTKFAIDVKETSMQLEKVTLALSDENDTNKGAFKKKIARSSNPDKIEVNYVGDKDVSDSDESFKLKVKQLATKQINQGNFLNPTEKNILPGKYSFDLENTSTAYEFQFNVNENDTNESVQKKVVRLINGANVGVDASIATDRDDFKAILLSSKETGKTEDERFLFKITPTNGAQSQVAINTLGINQVKEEAHNSTFELNGVEHNSLSNNFTINKEFEITLKGVSSNDEETTIDFETDINAIYENVNKLVTAYNSALQTATRYENNAHGGKLAHDISSISSSMKSSLESMGLIIQANGSIAINKEALSDAVRTDSAGTIFAELNNFKNAASAKAAKIAINPLEYVDKVVVAYKNPGQGFNTPYSTSIYAGLMLDSYA